MNINNLEITGSLLEDAIIENISPELDMLSISVRISEAGKESLDLNIIKFSKKDMLKQFATDLLKGTKINTSGEYNSEPTSLIKNDFLLSNGYLTIISNKSPDLNVHIASGKLQGEPSIEIIKDKAQLRFFVLSVLRHGKSQTVTYSINEVIKKGSLEEIKDLKERVINEPNIRFYGSLKKVKHYELNGDYSLKPVTEVLN